MKGNEFCHYCIGFLNSSLCTGKAAEQPIFHLCAFHTGAFLLRAGLAGVLNYPVYNPRMLNDNKRRASLIFMVKTPKFWKCIL